jgi:hypothetical protein
MTRTRLLRQVHGRWAWLTAAAAAAAAGLLVVRRGAPGRGQADNTATDTKPAEETAHGAAAVGTWLRQACTAVSSRISALGDAARREFFRNGGAPSEPDTAETAPPAAGTPAAAAPEQHKAAPGTGNGSAAQTPAADELPARDR